MTNIDGTNIDMSSFFDDDGFIQTYDNTNESEAPYNIVELEISN